METFVIISPCYNEEKGIFNFLKSLEKTLSGTEYHFHIIMVNDGSNDSTLEILKNFKIESSHIKMDILNLKYNIGHQKCIKTGLAYAKNIKAKGYIVMDSDGEDNPKAIKELVKKQAFDIVFISRGKRKNTLAFKLGYMIYKIIFKMISKSSINFGNYTMISETILDRIYLQNYVHYSAFLSKQNAIKELVVFDRESRIEGESKMKLSALIIHGIQSFIEYSEELLVFFIKVLLVLIALFIMYGGYSFYSKFIAGNAIPGWTSIILMTMINAILIIAGTIVLGLQIISSKNKAPSDSESYTIILAHKHK